MRASPIPTRSSRPASTGSGSTAPTPPNPAPTTAPGFYRPGITDAGPADREQHRSDVLDDIVATVGQSFLGVTIDCARCHDHKIDPIPQADYYKLLAFFQNINDYRNGGP